MNGTGFFDVLPSDRVHPRGFGKPAAPIDQILNEHASGREQVRNAGFARRTGGRPRRPQKNCMEMYDIEFFDFTLKRAPQRRCPIEPSEKRTRKISDLNAFQINWKADWHK